MCVPDKGKVNCPNHTFKKYIYKALRNYNRTIFEEMTSWTTSVDRNASRDEDSILDQICKNQICSEFYYGDF